MSNLEYSLGTSLYTMMTVYIKPFLGERREVIKANAHLRDCPYSGTPRPRGSSGFGTVSVTLRLFTYHREVSVFV